jgi:hypothetical protein
MDQSNFEAQAYTAKMAQKYAKDQPPGFTNRIERVAIVGVSCPIPPSLQTPSSPSHHHT